MSEYNTTTIRDTVDAIPDSFPREKLIEMMKSTAVLTDGLMNKSLEDMDDEIMTLDMLVGVTKSYLFVLDQADAGPNNKTSVDNEIIKMTELIVGINKKISVMTEARDEMVKSLKEKDSLMQMLIKLKSMIKDET